APSNAQPIRSPGNGKTYAVPRGTPASPSQSTIGTRQVTGTAEQPRAFDQGRTNPNRERPSTPAPGWPATPQWTNPQLVQPTQGARQRPPDVTPAEPQFHYGTPRAVPRGEQPNAGSDNSRNAEPAVRSRQPDPRG